MRRYKNVTEAFEAVYKLIDKQEPGPNGTKAIFNHGVTILDTENKEVTTPKRNFSLDYAEAEWAWYMSRDRDATVMAKRGKLWYDMMDEDGYVNSNYGALWGENDQIGYITKELKRDMWSRRAVITLYDGKRWETYERDTPCTCTIQFYQTKPGEVKMTVHMRSNDHWFGFPNDAFCFMRLQQAIAMSLDSTPGHYTHFVTNWHLYEKQWARL